MKKKVVEFAFIILAAMLLALAYQLFVVPNKFAPAGLNGIATMVQHVCGFSIGYMSLLINIPLCVLAFFLIDKNFAVKTLTFSVVYSVTYLLLGLLDLDPFRYDAGGTDTGFPVFIAGAISGLTYGICFRVNASTGGTDVISKFISKKKPLVNFFWVNFALNVVVAAISFFVYAEKVAGKMVYDYKPVVLCMLYCFTSSFVGNQLIKGGKRAYKYIIITTHAEEICEAISRELHHGATILDGMGAYSHANRQVIVSVVNKHQIVDMENILKRFSETFAAVETVNGTIGNFQVSKKRKSVDKND